MSLRVLRVDRFCAAVECDEEGCEGQLQLMNQSEYDPDNMVMACMPYPNKADTVGEGTMNVFRSAFECFEKELSKHRWAVEEGTGRVFCPTHIKGKKKKYYWLYEEKKDESKRDHSGPQGEGGDVPEPKTGSVVERLCDQCQWPTVKLMNSEERCVNEACPSGRALP